ncbi:lipase family protein [Chryseobacterium sp. CBSDS_008]|uniref:lipase family protein n=1 Tax=Chryseobacterium sp. CBSDS_008 TaxID=3415265 RepID=UPI003CFA8DAF
MTNPSLDAYQQVFGMAGLANRAGGYNGTGTELQQQLQYDLSYYLSNVPPVTIMGQTEPSTPNSLIPPLLGNWNLVWGPALIEETDENGKPTGVADNALYVAQCDAVAFPGGPTLPTYVVAIAATNPSSLYDWETEDFSVAEIVNWTTYDPFNFTPSPYNGTDPYISKGTATGIGILLGLTSPDTAASPNTTLQQLLSGLNPDPDTAIIFCGHSLAGALSPTLALYLKENKNLDAFGVALVYPTAGPTPGEAAFASLFNTTFPPLPAGWYSQTGDYQSWNTMHWNDLDVVPHAWPKADLELIADLYGPSPDKLTAFALDALQKVAIAEASESGAAYTRIRNQSLPGQLQKMDGSVPITIPPQSLYDYVQQLFLQHVTLYSGSPASDNAPAISGLILQQPLPQQYPPQLVPGVSLVTKDEMILKIIQQIIGWISSHYLADQNQLVNENTGYKNDEMSINLSGNTNH